VAATCDYDAAWQRIFSEAKMADAVVKLKPPTGAELVELVKRWAGARKLVLSSAAVAAMVECAGEETALLKGEVEKLATLFDPGTRIGEDEVRRVVSNTRGYELREYVDSIWPRRDTANALLVLNRLSSAGEAPVRIIYWLTTKLLDWVWSAKKGQAALERALDRLYEINYQVLQGHPEPYALLDVLTVCVGCFGQGPCGLSRLEKRPGFCLAARQPESRAN
jgi:DNA polymerase III delta subunit